MKITELFVFPSDQTHVDDLGNKYHYLVAYHTLASAYEYREQHFVGKKYTWSIPKPSPICFSAWQKPEQLLASKTKTYAPLSFWAVLDLDNGEPSVLHGKVYVFAFTTRKEARAFAKHQNYLAITQGKTRVGQPFQLFQG